jgi:hypothetical protein
LGSCHLSIWGLPLHFDKLNRDDLHPVIDKLIKRAARWRGRLLAYNSRLALIKSCMASIPIYLVSFIKFPKRAIMLIETQMSKCLWNGDSEVHMYHLASWKHVAMKKEYGGLGVPDLRELILCLRGSWVRRYCLDSDKIWRQLIDYKYRTSSPNLFCCKDSGVSNFWMGCCGLLELQKWVTSGKLVMEVGLDSEKISG